MLTPLQAETGSSASWRWRRRGKSELRQRRMRISAAPGRIGGPRFLPGRARPWPCRTPTSTSRHTQRAVVQQERLRALGEMASGIAHDINNSISPAAMFAELVLERETQPVGRRAVAALEDRTAGGGRRRADRGPHAGALPPPGARPGAVAARAEPARRAGARARPARAGATCRRNAAS